MLELLGTLGCHLCDDAERVLQQLACVQPLHWECVDIALNEALCEEFGERIPVLRLGEHVMLFWPFSVLDVQHFLVGAVTDSQ